MEVFLKNSDIFLLAPPFSGASLALVVNGSALVLRTFLEEIKKSAEKPAVFSILFKAFLIFKKK